MGAKVSLVTNYSKHFRRMGRVQLPPVLQPRAAEPRDVRLRDGASGVTLEAQLPSDRARLERIQDVPHDAGGRRRHRDLEVDG